MNVEMVAQMFANYRNNVKFHLEGMLLPFRIFSTNTAYPPIGPPSNRRGFMLVSLTSSAYMEQLA
jgi:hypothetical protein